MAREGATPKTVGARPLNNPFGPSVSTIYLLHVVNFKNSERNRSHSQQNHEAVSYLRQRMSLRFRNFSRGLNSFVEGTSEPTVVEEGPKRHA